MDRGSEVLRTLFQCRCFYVIGLWWKKSIVYYIEDGDNILLQVVLSSSKDSVCLNFVMRLEVTATSTLRTCT